MRWLTVLCALPLISCFDDAGYNQSQFASELAKASCRWIFACCDAAEQQAKGSGTTWTETDCITQKTTAYLTTYQSADAKVWNGQAARDCVVAVQDKATKCPRSFDVDTQVSSCQFVAATKKPGDYCSNTWDCTTKFCKIGTGDTQGVCANPLAENMACTAGEPCATGLRCAGGKCSALKVDGSSCSSGDECYAGGCVAGVCKVVPTYTCDGQN